MNQSEDKIVCLVKGFYPPIKEALTLYNVTYQEYLKFIELYVSKLAEYMGSTYTQKDTEEGLIVTIIKK